MKKCEQHDHCIMTRISRRIMTGLFLLILFPSMVNAQVDCSTLPHWMTLENQLEINQKHVFCGEWNRNRAKGFHSRPEGINPDTVDAFTVQDNPNAAGIYTGKWSYKDRAGRNKFSSMFPDSCSVEQVLNSIAYASGHQYTCPDGAPNWAQCGPNQPNIETKEVVAGKYCSVGNQRFTISFAPPGNGRINTAFPLFE